MISNPNIESLYAEQEQNETFRDKLSTVDEDGKRIWVYPKKPSGVFYKWRNAVSVLLLAFLFGAPFLKIDGQPFLLFNIFERKFIIFGQVFWPQDFHLAVLGMITLVVFIILFTVVYGRIFCGWICPQTIFMEMVFRKIEYWIEGDYTAQRKLDKAEWNKEKVLKKGSKHLIFLIISALIMHTFIAYLIGVDGVWRIIGEPVNQNMGGFTAMIVFTGLFYGVFSRMREQVCTTICPYGRLQGVLLDKDSVVVAYDHKRGENRGKFRKNEDRLEVGKGDCIDCKQCVYVCPTGIDIRNGTQLECVNCTACIDACDDIMERVNQPKGLIRYASEENIVSGTPFTFTKRTMAYSVVLVLLLGVFTSFLLIRSDTETTLLRTPGLTYQKNDNGTISNLYQISMVNKTNKDLDLVFKIRDDIGTIRMIGGNDPKVEAQATYEGALFIDIDSKALKELSTKLKIDIYSDGVLIETTKTRFLGPNL
ncbi:MAG: cytochrome c oxidase accessory protein CcoG [Bacteroidota bacterium]